MLFHGKNGTVILGSTEMDYIRFGSGKKTLVILPGLGDGLQTVKGTALPMALVYRIFGKDFTVYAFSRRNGLPVGHTTRDMARDQAEAMERLEIPSAAILGVSMGGMITQWLAIDFPAKVDKLILAVTAACPNPLLKESVEEWVGFAQKGDHTALMDSNLRRIYSEAYYRRNRWLAPIVGKLTKPKNYDRFFVQAEACLKHDAQDSLCRIEAPALVIGGGRDKALGGKASQEIAAAIPGAALHMYEQWGHGLYEEANDFQQLVLNFLQR